MQQGQALWETWDRLLLSLDALSFLPAFSPQPLITTTIAPSPRYGQQVAEEKGHVPKHLQGPWACAKAHSTASEASGTISHQKLWADHIFASL